VAFFAQVLLVFFEPRAFFAKGILSSLTTIDLAKKIKL
jgi:hypothetical protein